MELKISKKFEEALRKLTDNELTDLEKDLLQNGCTDPIITCDGVIVDGHNRYSICTKHNIAFDVKEISSRSESDCMKFIRQKQRARRNLTLGELQTIAKADEDVVKKAAKKKQGNDGKSLNPNSEKVNTLEETAKKAHIGKDKQWKINYITKHGSATQIFEMNNEVRKVHAIWTEIKAQEKLEADALADYKEKIAALPKAKPTDWAAKIRDPILKISYIPLSIAESATPEQKHEILVVLDAGIKMLNKMREAFGVFDKSDALLISTSDVVKPAEWSYV